MRLWAEEETVVAVVTLDDRHAGNPGLAHGGALATLLDEALGTVPLLLDAAAVTASLTVEFRAPAVVGRELGVRAWCEARSERKLHLRGEVRDGDRLLAEGTGLWIQVEPEHFERLGVPVPQIWHRPSRSSS